MPATVAVLDGTVRVGLEETELERVAAAGAAATEGEPTRPRTMHRRRLRSARRRSAARSRRSARSDIRTMATGGIGGVHRGYESRPDVSADLPELARSQTVVVCSGVKSLLDVPATLELLETLGVPVLGYATDTVPLFYARARRPARADPRRCARAGCAHRGGALVARGRRHPRHAPARSRARRRRAVDREGAGRGEERREWTVSASRRTCSRSSTSGAAVRRSRSTVGLPRTTPRSPSRSPPRSRLAEMAVYESDPDAAPDDEFEPGTLGASRPREPWAVARRPTDAGRRTRRVCRSGHVRRGDRGVRGHGRRLGDGGGASVSLPVPPGAGDRGRGDREVARGGDRAVRPAALDRRLREERAATEELIAAERERARAFIPGASPFDALERFLGEVGLVELDEAFASRYVSNASSGELVKGHAIVLAQLGLCPYDGKVVRSPDLFAGEWTEERRAAHVVARLAFVRELFAPEGEPHDALPRAGERAPVRPAERRVVRLGHVRSGRRGGALQEAGRRPSPLRSIANRCRSSGCS